MEYKFRAWDKNAKEMVYQDNMIRAHFNPFTVTRKDNSFALSDIMLASGVMDSKGIEIYAGDIVTGVKDGNMVSTSLDTIIFKDGCLCDDYHNNPLHSGLTIVGHIYQNLSTLK